jgi:hypothetical protein
MNCRTWTTSVLASLLITWPASATPDASTMKRLETVAFYLGAADHCLIKIETPRLRDYYRSHGALEPVAFGAIDKQVRLGSMVSHQPGSAHCSLTRKILHAEGIIDR